MKLRTLGDLKRLVTDWIMVVVSAWSMGVSGVLTTGVIYGLECMGKDVGLEA